MRREHRRHVQRQVRIREPRTRRCRLRSAARTGSTPSPSTDASRNSSCPAGWTGRGRRRDLELDRPRLESRHGQRRSEHGDRTRHVRDEVLGRAAAAATSSTAPARPPPPPPPPGRLRRRRIREPIGVFVQCITTMGRRTTRCSATRTTTRTRSPCRWARTIGSCPAGDRGQTTTFLPGNHQDAFTVEGIPSRASSGLGRDLCRRDAVREAGLRIHPSARPGRPSSSRSASLPASSTGRNLRRRLRLRERQPRRHHRADRATELRDTPPGESRAADRPQPWASRERVHGSRRRLRKSSPGP